MQTLFWQSPSTVPTDGTEFQAWLRRKSDKNDDGWWESFCRYDEESGQLQIYGRIDYDEDDWSNQYELEIIAWMAKPTKPEFDKENNDHE